MDLVGLAGLPHQRNRHPASDGSGADLCPALCAVCAGRHCRRGRSRCAGPSHEPAPAIPTPDDTDQSAPTGRKPPNGSIHKSRQPRPVLATEPSAVLRDQLIAEINDLKDGDDLALWAHRRLPAKNTLTADDARAVETACQTRTGPLQSRCCGSARTISRWSKRI